MTVARAERVAVLGAGIMGSLTALLLARRGMAVTLFEGRQEPLQGASRWNEGKIHLGYLYAADPSRESARQVLSGGLAFAPIVESVIGTSLTPHTTRHDDIYLVHRDSVVDIAAVAAHFEALTRELRDRAEGRHYLVDLSEASVSRLDEGRLASLVVPGLVSAGFSAPERSVDTCWLADQLSAALRAEPLIELRLGSRVTGASPLNSDDGPWQVEASGAADGPFGWVVNALWEGRLALDLKAGLPPAPGLVAPLPGVPVRQHGPTHGSGLGGDRLRPLRRRQELRRPALLSVLVQGGAAGGE